MGTKYYSVIPVACNRGGTYDAEIQFKSEEYAEGNSTPKYISKLLETGFFKRDNALQRAQEEAVKVEALIEQTVKAHLAKYPDAKE